MDGVVDPKLAEELERRFPGKVLRQDYFENLALADNSNVVTEGRLRCHVSLADPKKEHQRHGGWVDLVILNGTGPHPLLGWPAINRLNWELKKSHLLVTELDEPCRIPLLTVQDVAQHEDDLQAIAAMQLASVQDIRDTIKRDIQANGNLDEDAKEGIFVFGHSSPPRP